MGGMIQANTIGRMIQDDEIVRVNRHDKMAGVTPDDSLPRLHRPSQGPRAKRCPERSRRAKSFLPNSCSFPLAVRYHMPMKPSDFEALRAVLQAPDSLITNLAEQEKYFHDATDLTATPAAILLAESVGDTQAAVRFCHSHKIPITPRGAGTGLSGGCVPSNGALLISIEKLHHLTIYPEREMAVCGPGVITKTLQDEAAKHGLTYPPDPASYLESTLGGNVAEGAGGLRCRRFGVTKDYVLGMRAVLVDGSILNAGIFNENAGFSLGDLLISSEGTLAIVTEIAVRLIPIPVRGTTILVGFNSPTDAAKTVADITACGLIPTVLEFLDGDAAACSNQYEKHEGLDEVGALLLIETSGENQDAQTTRIKSFCETHRASYMQMEPDPEKAEALWKIRRNLSKAAKAAAKVRLSEDVAVPNSKFPDLVAFVGEMNAASPLRINSFGHAGDGNLHVNLMAQDDSPATMNLIHESVLQLMRKTLELGGTLTGEHGIGLAKRDFLQLEFDAATLDAMRKVKAVFDPEYSLNPDKLFADRPADHVQRVGSSAY